MERALELLSQCKTAFGERLCSIIELQHGVHLRQQAQCPRQLVRVPIWHHVQLGNRHRTLEQPLGTFVVALHQARLGTVIERLGHVIVIRPQQLLAHRQGALQGCIGLVVSAPPHQHRTKLGQRLGQARVVGSDRLLGEGHGLLQDGLGPGQVTER